MACQVVQNAVQSSISGSTCVVKMKFNIYSNGMLFLLYQRLFIEKVLEKRIKTGSVTHPRIYQRFKAEIDVKAKQNLSETQLQLNRKTSVDQMVLEVFLDCVSRSMYVSYKAEILKFKITDIVEKKCVL